MKSARALPMVGLLLSGLLTAALLAAPARADEPAPGAAAGTPGAPPQAPLPPGVRLVSGQATVVGGNSAGARERALDDAVRQAVEQALAEQLDAQTRAAQARAIKTLQGRARSYIKRYRTVDENESNGLYTVRIEAEVDDLALRRATERWTPSAPPPDSAGTPPGARPAASLMVVVSGPIDAGTALLAALASAGVRAQLGDPTLAGGDPGRAVQAAARAAFSGVAFVSAAVVDDGVVRGPGQAAVSCQLGAKVVSVPSGQSVAEASASPHTFADKPATARADCLSRAAAAVAPRLSSSGAGPAGSPTDLRPLVLDIDVVEPSAIAAFLRVVRGMGSVSSADVRRIVLGRGEIRVRTRLTAAVLAQALGRDNPGAPVVVSDVQVSGDLVRLKVRLRPAPAPSSVATP
jgi:hypothetical protein